MDSDIPNDRPGNSADEAMNVWLCDEYSKDLDIEFELDENDEYPVESLQPTIWALYKATTNEQNDMSSSTTTNHRSHIASCSPGIVTGIANLVPPNQYIYDDEHDKYLLESLEPTIGSLYKATKNQQGDSTSSIITSSCSSGMATGITNLVPAKQALDENDEYPMESLQPTIGPMYKATTNEQSTPSSTTTNHWSHIGSCSSGMATGIPNLVPPTQYIYDDEHDKYPLESLEPTIGSLYKATKNQQGDFTSSIITSSCSNGMATGITNLVPAKQALDENDEYPMESLQPTIGPMYKATTNEQSTPSSTTTNHWSHIGSCSSGMATGIPNLVPPTQYIYDDEHDKYPLESLEPTIGSLYKATKNQQGDFTSSIITSSCSNGMATGITNLVPAKQALDENDEYPMESLQPTIGPMYKATTNEQSTPSSTTTNHWSHIGSCSSGMATGIPNLVPPTQDLYDYGNEEYPLESFEPTIKSLYKATINQQGDFTSSIITASYSSGMATGITNLVPAKQAYDKNDEYPVEFLQPTIGPFYKATRTERNDVSSSTTTNHWRQITSCSSGMATGITNLVPSNQDLYDDENDEYPLESLEPTIGSLYKFTTNEPGDFKSSFINASCSGGMTTDIRNLVPEKRDLQIDLKDHIPENAQFRTDCAPTVLPQELPPSEEIAHKDVQSAETHHSRHQQHFSETPLLRYLLSQPPRSSMAMQNSQSFMIPQKRKPSSSKSLVHQPTESCPVQMISHEPMQHFINAFENASKILGLTRYEIRLLLNKLSGNTKLVYFVTELQNFSEFFKNMCQMKYLLEICLDRIHNSGTTKLSLRSKSEFTELGQQMQATIDSQMDGHLSNDRPDSTTGENTDCHVFREDSGVSVKDANYVDECRNKYEVPKEFLNSTLQIVPTSTTKKNHAGNIGICFNDNSTVTNLISSEVCLVHQPAEQNSERMSLEELQHFVNDFKKRRKELNLRQWDIIKELSHICCREISRDCIGKFENFNVFIKEICKLKPQLEQWLENVRISGTDVSIVKQNLQILKKAFSSNQNPTAYFIDKLAKQTTLHKDVLMFWFNKRRQIHEWLNSPTALECLPPRHFQI